jgi:dTDP-L-rhamnose 4-epimerase
MRILITGGAGFIGSHIADLLASEGHSVLLLDAFLPQAHGCGAVPEWVGGHQLIRGDVRDAELLGRLLPGLDAVCHQAAMVGHGLDPSDAPDYTANNDHATAVLLAVMHHAGVHRLVLASSMVVYGEGRYACPEHGVVPAAPRRAEDRGSFQSILAFGFSPFASSFFASSSADTFPVGGGGPCGVFPTPACPSVPGFRNHAIA